MSLEKLELTQTGFRIGEETQDRTVQTCGDCPLFSPPIHCKPISQFTKCSNNVVAVSNCYKSFAAT